MYKIIGFDTKIAASDVAKVEDHATKNL